MSPEIPKRRIEYVWTRTEAQTLATYAEPTAGCLCACARVCVSSSLIYGSSVSTRSSGLCLKPFYGCTRSAQFGGSDHLRVWRPSLIYSSSSAGCANLFPTINVFLFAPRTRGHRIHIHNFAMLYSLYTLAQICHRVCFQRKFSREPIFANFLLGRSHQVGDDQTTLCTSFVSI